MNISEIKIILSEGHIPSDWINPMITVLKEDDLRSLSSSEKESLREVISKILVMVQDPSSGAYLDDQKKAELLLFALS